MPLSTVAAVLRDIRGRALAREPVPAYIARMFRLCFQRDFTARHFLTGGDWGPENAPHPHRYRIEWELRAQGLDAHGYLIDLVEIEHSLGDALGRYRDALLNDLPEFAGLNPSLERFVKLLWDLLSASLPPGVSCAVRLWENESAWAGYDGPLPGQG